MNLEAVGIVVTNLEKALEFYTTFDLKFEAVSDGHYEAVTKNGVRIMLDTLELMKEINGDHIQYAGSNVVLCHKLEASHEVDDLYRDILQKGFEGVRAPWDAFWGQRYASVRDSDGNQIDLFADL